MSYFYFRVICILVHKIWASIGFSPLNFYIFRLCEWNLVSISFYNPIQMRGKQIWCATSYFHAMWY